MKIVIIGATGFVGSGILSESLERGHDVTAIVTNPDRLPTHPKPFVCPAAMLAHGERTGEYRVGGDELLKGPDGRSRISIEDYAVAMLDEVEMPRHPRARFSVAY